LKAQILYKYKERSAHRKTNFRNS